MNRLGVVLLLVLATGCGGGGGDEDATATFRDDRFDVTFEYPADFELGRETTVQRTAGSESTARRGVGLDEDNAIFLSRYDLAAEVGEENADEVQAELDGVVSELVDAEVTGRRADVGGFIAFRYDDLAVEPPADGVSDLVFLFEGRTQYQVNCQSTPLHRSRIEAACELAVDTLAAT